MWGVLPLGLLIAFAVSSKHEAIETDLRERTSTKLEQVGLGWARTGFEGRDGQIDGAAYTPEQRREASDIVRSVWGVRIADNRASVIEEQENYTWTARRDGGQIQLTGFVPDSETRATIIGTARELFADARIADEMKPARGAPERALWVGGIKFALSQLSRLEPGAQVDMRDRDFAINGRARTVGDYARVRGALAQALPDGVRLVKDEITPPAVSPYTWSAAFDGKQVVFEGHVPNDQARSTLADAVKRTFPSAAIVDKMVVASGQPNRWLLTVGALLREIKPLKTVALKLEDAVVTVIGLAEREATATDVRAALERAVRRPFTLDQDIKFNQPDLPVADPYETSIAVTEAELLLTGSVPSQAQRQALLQRATEAFPNRKVTDNLSIARGQPDGWSTCINSGLSGLQSIGNGRLRMIDAEFTLFGETRDPALQTRLAGRLRASTSRSCRTNVALSILKAPEPKLRWQAQRTDGTVVLSGEVPDSRTRTALIDKAQTLFPNIIVDDRMRVSPARSEVWSGVAMTGLELLARLRSGAATLNAQQLTITGEAPDTGAATVIKQRLASSLAEGYSGTDRVLVKSDAMIWSEREARQRAKADDERRVAAAAEARRQAEARRRAEIAAEEERRREEAARRRAEEARLQAERAAEDERKRRLAEEERKQRLEAEAKRADAEAKRIEAETARIRAAQDRCQRALDSVKSTGKINFELARSDIKRSSYSILNRIADAVINCENVRIDISGHTDSQGTDENNQRLSERRAQAVVAFLVDAGVDRSRLNATGFGESQPLVPNTTSDNRARNRRIEFTVRRE
ncbi:MAG: OmpA family protein [Pseudomonadota bacterium]